jgi:hypothetical protein
MTVLLDTAALAGLLLALTFVPALWHRADRRITRQLEQAGVDRVRAPVRRHADAPRRPAAARRTTGRTTGRTAPRTAARA